MMAACGITGLFKLRMIEHCGRWVLTNVEAELINSSTLQFNDDIEVLSCNDRYVYSVLHSDALLIISKVHSQHPLIWWRSNCKQSSHTHLLLWWRPLLEAVLLFFSSVFWSIVPPNKEGDSIFSWSISRNITLQQYSTVRSLHFPSEFKFTQESYSGSRFIHKQLDWPIHRFTVYARYF